MYKYFISNRLLLMLLLSLFLFYGCNKNKVTPADKIAKYTQEMRDGVVKHVSDKAEREKALNLIFEMESVMQEFSGNIDDYVDRYRMLDKNYQSTRESYEKLNSAFSEQREKAQARIISLHFSTVALLSKYDWDRIVKYEQNALKSAIEARDAAEKEK